VEKVTSYKQQWAPEPVYSIETSSRKDVSGLLGEEKWSLVETLLFPVFIG